MTPIIGSMLHFYPPRSWDGNADEGPWAAVVTAVRAVDGMLCVTSFPPDRQPRLERWVRFLQPGETPTAKGLAWSGCCVWPAIAGKGE